MPQNIIHLSLEEHSSDSIMGDVFKVAPTGDFLDRLSAVLYPPRRVEKRNEMAEILVVDFNARD